MSRTNLHVIAGVGWFLGLPIAFIFCSSYGISLSGLDAIAEAMGVFWGGGLVAVFCSWALKDSTEHGKSQYMALIFTLAWFVLLFFSVFPYLFVTRGAKEGLLASLKYLCLLIATAIAFIAVLPLLGRTFF